MASHDCTWYRYLYPGVTLYSAFLIISTPAFIMCRIRRERFRQNRLGDSDMSLIPTSWQWERDAAGFYKDHHNVFVFCAAMYYPTIFGIKALMKHREPFDLGGGGSKAPVNYIFWWEVGLAVFSLVGAYHIVPVTLEPLLSGKSYSEAICMPGVHDDPRSFWTFLFMVSKLFEFGDTIFVVLRKKPLILLQHYHHLATMLYCWYGTLHVYPLNNTNTFFCAMNLCVHSVMYSWYAATRTGWKSPKVMMMGITLLQLLQMVCGVFIIVTSVSSGSPLCGKWKMHDPVGLYAAFGMCATPDRKSVV